MNPRIATQGVCPTNSMHRYILLGMVSCLVACSAPQGKKVARADASLDPVASGPGGLAPVASGPGGPGGVASSPIENVSTVTISDHGRTIGVSAMKTLTVTLPSYNRDGYEWRLSEIPDPSVLKLVSKE